MVWGCVAGRPCCVSVSASVHCGATLCALYLGGVHVRLCGRAEALRLGGRGGLWSLFSASRPPSFLPHLRGGMNEVSIWFPQSPGVRPHSQVCDGIYSPPRGAEGLQQCALCVCALWSLAGGWVAGGQAWGCHRSRLASRGARTTVSSSSHIL